MFDFHLFSIDGSEVYINRVDKLMTDFYMRSLEEFENFPNHFLELLKRLYDLAVSGDYSRKTLSKHIGKERDEQTTVGYDALLIQKIRDQLNGMCATYDDSFFKQVVQLLKPRTKRHSSLFCSQL